MIAAMSNSMNGAFWLNMQHPRGSAPPSPMLPYATPYPQRHLAVHVGNQASPQVPWNMANSVMRFAGRGRGNVGAVGGGAISPMSNQYNHAVHISPQLRTPENFYNVGAGVEILHQIPKGPDPAQDNLSGKRPKRQLDGGNMSNFKRQRLNNQSEAVSPGPLLEITGYDKISTAMMNYFSKHHQAEEVYRKKMKLRDALYGIIQGVFPYCGLYAVGSSMSGFGTNKSDMDLCLMLTHEQIDQKREATEILNLVHRGLKKCSFIKTSQVIKAKVPILKFWDDISRVECDLNINNSVGIRNTHLLKAYARLDWRVMPLVLFIKYWSRFHDINDARKQTISSYSLGLMAIHYLQCGTKPPVLPSLQKLYPDVFSISNDISSLRLDEELPPYKSENEESLGDLFLGFLKYYATNFDFKRSAISIRTGTKLPIEIVKHKVGTPGQWKCLCIEEPFDLSNTARAVFDEDTFTRVYRVFQTSYKRLDKRKDVNDILTRPF